MSTGTRQTIRDAAERIRGVAATAANDSAGDVLDCWERERIGGHERVIAMRRYLAGTDDEIIAVPTVCGVAEHVATWDPPAAVLVAELLLLIATPTLAAAVVQEAAVKLARALNPEPAGDLVGNVELSSSRPVAVQVNHAAKACEGGHCCIHNPSDHHMAAWPLTFRTGRAIPCPTHGDHGLVLTERLCPHGVGHPDPDSLAWLRRHDPAGVGGWGVHGCDLCCRAPLDT